MSNLGVINWIVLLVYFVAMMILGTQVGKSNSNTESYFLGSRKIPWWASGLSVHNVQPYRLSVCLDGDIQAVCRD